MSNQTENLENPFTQLCVWPGTYLGEGSPADLEDFFMQSFGTRVKYKCEVLTRPDIDDSGRPVPHTGGRSDLFFYVHRDDVSKFAIPRLKEGIRWWEDVISYNDNGHLYSEEFLAANPATW